jgi:ATP-dependent helicase/DNAse subunit B
VHDLLRALYEECLSGAAFGGLADAALAAAVARAGAILDRLGRIHAENHPATWQAEREKTLEQLAALLEHERKEHATARPARFEHEFGLASQGHSLTLDDGQTLTFRGRIDRVDALSDGGIRVVDYKTGKADRYKRDALAGGTQLQSPIYLLAACEAMQAERGRALYLCVDEAKDVPEFTSEQLTERIADFRAALGLIVDGIAAGNFFPMPAEDQKALRYCSEYCPNSIACGSARSKLAEMKQADPDLSGLRALREIK